MSDTPVSRLRELHRLWPILDRPDVQLCIECADPYPCDVIAALDELEERDDLSYEPEALREFRERGYVTKEVDALQARIDAATVLIRQALHQSHAIISLNGVETCRVCGSPFGTSIDTCPNCAPFRAWLAGDKEAGK